ncbi:hypothetical protein AAFF_G00280060 [Aldrovandia affinis]|uniref:Uncharacterized protein n=1 Tax=Aldrovandia affinis TaxID=143900 RepID=A0AAD7W1Q9_9TELE|nr:hypothetical protein AAFF_G00280060 [Aldrovandia affinis]
MSTQDTRRENTEAQSPPDNNEELGQLPFQGEGGSPRSICSPRSLAESLPGLPGSPLRLGPGPRPVCALACQRLCQGTGAHGAGLTQGSAPWGEEAKPP